MINLTYRFNRSLHQSASFLPIQSEYRKIRTRNNSVFGHFLRSTNLRIQSEGAKRPEITLYLNTFHSVVNLRNQTKYTKIRTRNNSIFAQFWPSASFSATGILQKKLLQHLILKQMESYRYVGFICYTVIDTVIVLISSPIVICNNLENFNCSYFF